MSKSCIGFIGLGHMGRPMVQRLLKYHEVYVYDKLPEAMAALAKDGAILVQSAEEMANHAEVIMTSIQTGQQLKMLYLGAQGLFSRAKPQTLLIDCSSIDIETTLQLHGEAKSRGLAMVDAPVSGGVAGAIAGTLTVMVGGEAADVARARPILNLIGKRVIHAGQAGLGQAAKICNNLLLGISMIGVSEAFTLAEKLGLDPKTFFDISSQSSGQCWSMTSYCPVPNILEQAPSNHDYQPGFMAKMMLKDLYLGQQAAQSVAAVTPLGALTTALYQLYVNGGHGEKDFSGIIQLIANYTGS